MIDLEFKAIDWWWSYSIYVAPFIAPNGSKYSIWSHVIMWKFIKTNNLENSSNHFTKCFHPWIPPNKSIGKFSYKIFIHYSNKYFIQKFHPWFIQILHPSFSSIIHFLLIFHSKFSFHPRFFGFSIQFYVLSSRFTWFHPCFKI